MDLIWREPRVLEAAPSLTAICRLFEDAARRHATHLGLGVEHLHAAGRAWVLSRLSLRVHAMPAAGAPVDVLTWPSRRTAGVRAARDFELRGLSGALLAEAASIWLILDLKSRRPTRLPAELLGLKFPSQDTQVTCQPIPESSTPAVHFTRTVTESDLDENHHVNNVSYVAWSEPYLPPSPAALDIEYLAEAFLGDPIDIAVAGPHILVSSNSRLLARLSVA